MMSPRIALTLFLVSLAFSAAGTPENLSLEREAQILEKLSICALDIRLRDGVLIGEGIRLPVPIRAVNAKDGYAIVEATGQFHGFEIVRIIVPTTEARDVFDLVVLTLRASIADVRKRLLNDWATNFLPVPPPGKMGIAFASDNSIPRMLMYAETLESSDVTPLLVAG